LAKSSQKLIILNNLFIRYEQNLSYFKGLKDM